MSSNFDEVIRLALDVTGTDGVAALQKALQSVADSGSEAAPKAQELVDALNKLGAQDGAARALVAEKAALVDLGNALFLAQQRAAELQAEFDATAAPTATLTRNLQKATAAVATLDAEYNASALAVTKAQLALEAAGVDANNLDAAQRGLQASMAGVRAEAAGLATSLESSAAAGQAEALSLTEIAERSSVLQAAFENLKVLLGTFAGFIALEKAKEEIGDILDTGDKFTKWGEQFAAAFGGAQQGEDALAKVKEIADQTPLSLDQVTQAALQAKREGLDPFNGSLTALINATTKFGGGSEQLNELITALGRSANEGGLNIRTLTTLEQQGIPAATLLGNAIGKTADQVTELAKQGKLGADSVGTLIDALGRSTGGVGDSLDLLSTQVTKVRDDYSEFLKLIAQSGVYDFVRDQLKALNAELKQGLEDGSLQASAKAISDGLVTLGQALLSVTKFATQHAGAIITVVEQYALFKGALLALDLIGAAQKFVSLTTATKAAGDAAAAAAAEGGGFGKLRAVIGQIPRSVQIAVAVAGAADAISETIQLINTLTDIHDLNEDVAKQKADDAVTSQKLLSLTKQTSAQTLAAAQVQIATVEQLSQKNQQQSATYIQSLKDAIKYYESLKVQDEALGDTGGAEAASNKVRALSVALQEATKYYGQINAALTKSADLAASTGARFYDLNLRAVAAAQAVAGIFDNIQFNDPKGIGQALALIDSVSRHSTDAANAIKSELVDALGKLNAEDLSAFQANVTQRLSEAKGNADALKIAVGASLQAEMEKLGLSAEQTGQQFTKAGQEIITAFAGIATNAQATGQQIQLSFAQALSKVTTSGEVQALEQQLQNAFAAGKISADQFTAGMQAAGRKLADIQTTAVSASAALDGTGQAGQDAAQRVVLAWESARDDLAAQAQAISKEITAGLDTGVDVTALKAKLASLEAGIADYNGKIAAASASNKTASTSFQQVAQTASDAGDSVGKLSDEAKDAEDATTGFGARGTEALQILTQALVNARAQFSAVSDAAAKAFDSHLVTDFFDTFDSTGAGFSRVIDAMNSATSEVNAQLTAQRTQLQGEIADLNSLGTASDQGFGAFGTNAAAAAAKMQNLADLITQGKYDAGLLGQQELQPLQQALEAAAQRAKDLADQTQAAISTFEQLVSDTQDALYEAAGNQEAIEDRRHEQALANLQAEAKAANKLNSQEYQQAVANENALHALKLKNLQTQNQSSGSGSSAGGSSTATSGDGSTAASGLASRGAPTQTIAIHLNGPIIGTNPKDLAKYLGMAMKDELQSIQARSRVNIITGKPN